MSQLVTRQRPFPSFADVRADLRLAELYMVKSFEQPLGADCFIVEQADCSPIILATWPSAPPSGCRGVLTWQHPQPARPRRLTRCRVGRLSWWSTSWPAVAFLHQPMDRVHFTCDPAPTPAAPVDRHLTLDQHLSRF
jgi:hypothetical protein